MKTTVKFRPSAGAILFLVLCGTLHAYDHENTTLIGRWGYGSCFAASGDGVLMYFGNGAYFQIADFDDPADPEPLSEILLESRPRDILPAGDLVYVAGDEAGLYIIDVSDPTSPSVVGHWETNGEAWDVELSGDYAYVANGSDELRILEVSNPDEPEEVGFLNTRDTAYGVCVRDTLVFVADGDRGLRIGTVSDPSNPEQIGRIDTESYAYSVDVHGGYAYVADGEDGMRVIDVSDPAEPREVAEFATRYWARQLTVRDTVAYIADYQEGLVIVDISEPESPDLISIWSEVGGLNQADIAGGVAYTAESSSAAIVDLSRLDEPQLLGSIEAGPFYIDLAMKDDYLLCDDGRSIHIFDVSDPAAPLPANRIEVDAAPWRYAVEGDLLYTATWDSGLVIYDVSNLPEVNETGRLVFGDAVGLTVDDGYAYVACRGDGVRIIDVSDPREPVQVGHYQDEWPWWNIAVQDGYAFISFYWIFGVIDVSEPDDPRLVSQIFTFIDAEAMAVSGDYVYLAAGEDGLNVIDISDVENPRSIRQVNTPDFGYDLAMDGCYLYLADWHSGVRVFDITSPNHPQEVGWFDTGDIVCGIAARDSLIYVTDGGDGIYVIRNDHYLTADEPPSPSPAQFVLHPNYPNPFNAATRIRFDLDRAEFVIAAVFDLSGREVRRLQEGFLPAGRHSLTLDAGGLASGAYLLRLDAGGRLRTVRMVVER